MDIKGIEYLKTQGYSEKDAIEIDKALEVIFTKLPVEIALEIFSQFAQKGGK
jgi:hypothetical protein